VQGKNRRQGRRQSELPLDLMDAVPVPDPGGGADTPDESEAAGPGSEGEAPSPGAEALSAPLTEREELDRTSEEVPGNRFTEFEEEDGADFRAPAVFEFEDRGPVRQSRAQREAPSLRQPEPRRQVAGPRSESVSPIERRLETLEAAAEYTDDPAILSELGEIYLGQARYNEAEHWLRRAQRLDPDRVDVRTRLGILAYRRGLYVQAEADLLWACDHDPQDSMAYLYRGEALNQLGRIDEAMEAVEAALRLSPEHPRPHYLMGILLDRKNRNQEAGAMYRRARELSGR